VWVEKEGIDTKEDFSAYGRKKGTGNSVASEADKHARAEGAIVAPTGV
jgi:hypothetical protein